MPEWKDVGLRIRWILTCLVFFALPFLLIINGFGKKWDVRERESAEQVFERLDSVLMSTRAHEDTAEYFRMMLDSLANRAAKTPASLMILKRGFSLLKSRFPGIFAFYVVDAQGTIIPEFTEPRTPNAPLKKMFKVQQAGDAKPISEEEFNRSWTVMKNFAGNQVSPFGIKKTSNFIPASLGNDNHWFYFSTFKNLGIYAHLTYIPGFEFLSIRHACDRFRKANPRSDMNLGLFNIAEPFPRTPGFIEALTEFRDSSAPHLFKGGRFFTFMPISTTTFLWSSCPAGRAESLNTRRVLASLLGMVFFTLLALQSFRVMVLGIPMHFPIRWRLIALFGFASGLPIAVIFFAGWDYADQTYRNRVRETQEEGERLLKKFDAQFRQMLGTWETMLNRALKNCNYETPGGIRHTDKVIRAIHQQFPESGASLFNKKGNFVHGKKSEAFAFKFLGTIARKLLCNFNREEEDTGTIDATGLLLESVQGRENPLDEMSRSMGTITPMSFANSESWVYARPILSKTGKATHLLYVDWRKSFLERVYLKRNLRATVKKRKGTMVFSTSSKLEEFFPSEWASNNGLQRFFRDLYLRQGTTFGKLRIGNKQYLLTGIKPKELVAHLLVAAQPIDQIKAEIRLLEHRLWGLSVISAVISLFLGYLLSQRLLTPIGHLSAGVEAIRQRAFEHRLPPGEKDELGELAATFNHVMEGLSELEVGRIVQESLLPREEIKVGEYRIFGKTVTSTELGGDYFELETFPDGRVLILIGDVTGHGVPAALVMAMAKALVAARTFEGSSSPESILDLMHKVIYKTLKRKRLMTCFVALLDPENHKMTYSNAGQNFPYYLAAGKDPAFLDLPSMPLGSKKISNFTLACIDLHPGGKILFYTDGIVEQKSRTGEMIGYNRMIESVAPLLSDDPKDSYEKIFSWYKNTIGEEHQDDDVTIVLLCRAGVPSSPPSPG